MADLGNCRVCEKQMKQGFFANIADEPDINDSTICLDCGAKDRRRLKIEAESDPALREQLRLRQEAQERREELRKNAVGLAKNILVSTTDQIYGREITANLGIARGGTGAHSTPPRTARACSRDAGTADSRDDHVYLRVLYLDLVHCVLYWYLGTRTL